MKKIQFVLFAVLVFLSASCKMIFGIKSPKLLSDAEIEKYATKYHIPMQNVYAIDTTLYFQQYRIINKYKHSLAKDLMQPLQIKGFEEAGNMSLFLINCNMGGINIDWNKVGSFNTFPPQQNTIKRPDTLLVLQNDIKFYRALKQNSMASQSDYTFVVFWSRFMHRQSKKLVKQILDYQNKHSDKKINSFFVNVDNLYSRQK